MTPTWALVSADISVELVAAIAAVVQLFTVDKEAPDIPEIPPIPIGIQRTRY
jgi:hypothetical protein